MTNFRVKPTGSSVAMMRATSIIVLIIGIGMLIGAFSGGLLEEAGPFGIVWTIACVSIIVFALFSAFSRKGVAGGIVEIEQDGDATGAFRSESVESRLNTLEELKRKGLVSDQEYRSQRERILKSV